MPYCKKTVGDRKNRMLFPALWEKEELMEAVEKKKTDEATEDIEEDEEEENNEIEAEGDIVPEQNDEEAQKLSDSDSEEDNEAIEDISPNKTGDDGARKRKMRKD